MVILDCWERFFGGMYLTMVYVSDTHGEAWLKEGFPYYWQPFA